MAKTVNKAPLSTGRKIWIWTALVISVLLAALMVGSIIGTWVTRGIAIDVASAALTGVSDVAGVGREVVDNIDGGVAELRVSVGEVEDAVDQVSQNVSDKGLVLTLLPPEREQELMRVADEVSATVDTIVGVIDAAAGIWQSIGDLPFVNLPTLEPEKAAELEASVRGIAVGVDQLASDIQELRDGASDKVDTVVSAAGAVNERLGETQDNLATLDSDLERIQTRALELIRTFRTVATLVAIVAIFVQAWLVYALVVLIMKYWAEWSSRNTLKPATKK